MIESNVINPTKR